jgi:hypothetical protein
MQNIRSESRNLRPSPRVRAARRRAGVLLAGVVLAGPFGAPKLLAAVPDPVQLHVVDDGESLWELARIYSPGGDPRAFVHEVRRLNHLASPQVFPGQSLILPH